MRCCHVGSLSNFMTLSWLRPTEPMQYLMTVESSAASSAVVRVYFAGNSKVTICNAYSAVGLIQVLETCRRVAEEAERHEDRRANEVKAFVCSGGATQSPLRHNAIRTQGDPGTVTTCCGESRYGGCHEASCGPQDEAFEMHVLLSRPLCRNIEQSCSPAAQLACTSTSSPNR